MTRFSQPIVTRLRGDTIGERHLVNRQELLQLVGEYHCRRGAGDDLFGEWHRSLSPTHVLWLQSYVLQGVSIFDDVPLKEAWDKLAEIRRVERGLVEAAGSFGDVAANVRYAFEPFNKAMQSFASELENRLPLLGSEFERARLRDYGWSAEVQTDTLDDTFDWAWNFRAYKLLDAIRQRRLRGGLLRWIPENVFAFVERHWPYRLIAWVFAVRIESIACGRAVGRLAKVLIADPITALVHRVGRKLPR